MKITRRQLRKLVLEQVEEELAKEKADDPGSDYEAYIRKLISLGMSAEDSFLKYQGFVKSLKERGWYQPEFIKFFDFAPGENILVTPEDIARVEGVIRDIDRYYSDVPEAQDAKAYLEEVLPKVKAFREHKWSVTEGEMMAAAEWFKKNYPEEAARL